MRPNGQKNDYNDQIALGLLVKEKVEAEILLLLDVQAPQVPPVRQTRLRVVAEMAAGLVGALAPIGLAGATGANPQVTGPMLGEVQVVTGAHGGLIGNRIAEEVMMIDRATPPGLSGQGEVGAATDTNRTSTGGDTDILSTRRRCLLYVLLHSSLP